MTSGQGQGPEDETQNGHIGEKYLLRPAPGKATISPVSPSTPNELPASLGHHVLEACAAPMIIFERSACDCLVRYVNPAFSRRTGYSLSEIARIGWDRLHIGGGRGQEETQLRTAIQERRELEMPLHVHGKDGVTFSASLHVSPVNEAGAGAPRYAVGVLREHVADPEYVTRLEREAHYDPLTGLPNRRLLAERAERAAARALCEDHLLAVALIDLDDFKLVNDTMGHAAGDQVLCAVGARLAHDLRAGDFVARVGGDEFVLLLHEANGDFSLGSVVDRLRQRIEQPLRLDGRSFTVGCSIGVAIFPMDGRDLEAILEQADRAMYRQKARRRPTRPSDRPTLHQSALA